MVRTRSSVLAAAFAAAAVAFSLGTTYADKTQWFPDTRHYAVGTLEILGRSRAEAKAEAGAFLARRGVTEPIEVVDRPGARLFHPRILYPLLSAPFVALSGLGGMLVVPFAATLAFCGTLWRLVARRAPPWTAAAAVALVANARSFSVYSIAALTDGLALALMAGVLLALPGEERPQGAPRLVFAAALAAGFTREIGPYLILLAIAGLWWARGRDEAVRAAWRRTVVALASAGLLTAVWTAALARLGLLSQIELATGKTGGAAIGALPSVVGGILADTGAALAKDWPLLVVFLAALVAVPRARRRIEACLAAAALAGAIGLLAVNPIFTKFRLQLTLVPFAAMLAARLFDRAARDERPKPAPEPPV